MITVIRKEIAISGEFCVLCQEATDLLRNLREQMVKAYGSVVAEKMIDDIVKYSKVDEDKQIETMLKDLEDKKMGNKALTEAVVALNNILKELNGGAENE